MAIRTKVIVQQVLSIDDTTTTASKYPKYTVVLGNSISSITAGELTAAVEASAASAAAAKDSEIAAKESELNAKDSENDAAISAGSAETSATQAAASASESEQQASRSKVNADASAASATESKDFRDAAELAAQNAEQSRRLAEQAKTAAQTAQVNAETAKAGAETAQTNAEGFANTAGEYAAAAKQSELNAKTSETNAAAHEVEAGNQAGTATTEADRAKAEADRAAQVVDSKLDKVDISGFIKVYKTKAEADADVTSRVLGEKVLVWNQTESKYGWYKVAGTEEAPTLELVEVEQRLVSVNNVHADDAGNVQITLPGGNPSLWLGEVTWFPYNKDSGVGYPGVLPADGREVLRVDYPDTWEAIEAGLIPSVTEEQWQAGATLYFSTGNGTTTFRLPDMMQGQAFRAAAKGEENAGSIKEQIPYITMINGKTPEDDGTITLGNAANKDVWNGTDGEVLLRGAFGLGGTGIALNEPDLVSFFKACRAFGSGYYRNETAIGGLPAYSAGFYSKTSDTHSFICPQYSSGIVFVGTINDAVLDGENPTVNTNILYGTANKPNLNDDTLGVLSVTKGGTGGASVDEAKANLKVNRLVQADTFTLVNAPDNTRLVVGNSGELGFQNTEGLSIGLPVSGGGTGAITVDGARNNLGLGKYQTPRFAHLDLVVGIEGDGNGGILNLNKVNSAEITTSQSRIYHEVQNGKAKTTIHTRKIEGGEKNHYLHIDEDGNLTNVNALRSEHVYTGGVSSTGWISAHQNNRIGCITQAGGNKDIYLSNVADDGAGGGWVNLIQGNFYNGWWQMGGRRTGSDSLQNAEIRVNSGKGQEGWFVFNPNGRLVVSQGFNAYAPANTPMLRMEGTATGETGCFASGLVASGGWVDWRTRPCGMLVESPATDSAVNVFKVVKWGTDWVTSMDCVAWSAGGATTRINVSGASYEFNHGGTATAAAWVSTSDIRLKANLNKIESAREKVKSLVGYTYYKRNNTQEEDEHSIYSIEAGLVAQDVQLVLPEAVEKIGDSDLLGVNYAGVTALLTNALNELSEEFATQQEELKSVKAELAELKALVATLVNK
ncbi:tail fiber protein [Salmonella phage STG2]|uniref:Tail fiber protein n=1 Tax=Salmonella phage STG2 TaxID=2480623 RepID=A0A3G2KAG1_9CAUD|nr:tail fiber protein [Salmonella phage STG2]AYN55983.1 tail fiber protein [Salmonella phage STG2]